MKADLSICDNTFSLFSSSVKYVLVVIAYLIQCLVQSKSLGDTSVLFSPPSIRELLADDIMLAAMEPQQDSAVALQRGAPLAKVCIAYPFSLIHSLP